MLPLQRLSLHRDDNRGALLLSSTTMNFTGLILLALRPVVALHRRKLRQFGVRTCRECHTLPLRRTPRLRRASRLPRNLAAYNDRDTLLSPAQHLTVRQRYRSQPLLPNLALKTDSLPKLLRDIARGIGPMSSLWKQKPLPTLIMGIVRWQFKLADPETVTARPTASLDSQP